MNKKTQTLLKGNFRSKITRRKACYIVTRKRYFRTFLSKSLYCKACYIVTRKPAVLHRYNGASGGKIIYHKYTCPDLHGAERSEYGVQSRHTRKARKSK